MEQENEELLAERERLLGILRGNAGRVPRPQGIEAIPSFSSYAVP